jgi:WD40 repeat protein
MEATMGIAPALRTHACLLFVAVATAGRVRAAETVPTFDEQVLPILREHCCSCHNPDKRKGGLDLTSHGQAMAGGSSGEVIAPGDPDGSHFWQLVSHAAEPRMPPESDKLPADALDVIRRWIVGGAVATPGAAPSARKTASIAVAAGAVGEPEGPPVMPPRLSLDVITAGSRPTTVTALAASPHGDVVVIGGRQQVLVYHSGTLEFLGVLPFPDGVVKTLRFTKNGRLLLAGGGVAAKSGRAVVWDVAKAERLAVVGDEYDEVLAADLSPDQSLVALGGPGRVVRLHATADGTVAGEIRRHTDWVTAVEFSPDGSLLATGDRAGNLFLWETRGVREAGVLRGHTGPITAVAWRRDGGILASVSGDGTLRLWDPATAAQVKTWPAHGGGAEAIAWLADGRIVTTGRDRRAKLWNADGRLDRELAPLADNGTRVAATADGTRIFAADWGGTVAAFTAADGKQAGTIDANPPKLESRLQQAETSLAEIATATRSATDRARSAADAFQTVESQLNAARKAMEEAAGELDTAKARESEAAKVVDRWKAELEFSKSRATPR